MAVDTSHSSFMNLVKKEVPQNASAIGPLASRACEQLQGAQLAGVGKVGGPVSQGKGANSLDWFVSVCKRSVGLQATSMEIKKHLS